MASISISTLAFETLTDLRAQAGTSTTPVLLLGLSSVNDGNGGTYMWNSTSTATDDGFTIVKVNNVTTGRWIRQYNPNTIKGNTTFSSVSLVTTAYNISFGMTLPVVPAMVIIQAYSAGAAVPSWVSNVTTTGFTANFATGLTVGTNNITIYYLIIKQ